MLIAILMPVVLGFGGLAIDVGEWYSAQAQMQLAADAAALAGAADLPSNPTTAKTDAHTLGTDNASGATVAATTPYNSSSSEIQVTVSEAAPVWLAGILGIKAPTVKATAVAESTTGSGGFIYASSGACNAISIANSDLLSIKSTIWSNGGITATGQPITVSGQVDVPNTLCPFPSLLTPPGPTSVGTYSGWPQALPTTTQGNLPSSCGSAAITISDPNGWMSSNPPGMYCTTSTITIFNNETATFSGYEFVSENTSSTAIDVQDSGTLKFTGYCPSSCSSGNTPRTLFYATAGGIDFGTSTAATFTGDIFAPAGQVLMDVSGGSTTTGFIEASTVSLANSNSTTITGTGPTPSGTVKLIA